jgi:hypothetical protein
VGVMKVPTTGGNTSTGKTSGIAISTRKVFTVVTVEGVMAVAITVEAGIAVEAEVTAAAGVATKNRHLPYSRRRR